jgi:hypothetical protein
MTTELHNCLNDFLKVLYFIYSSKYSKDLILVLFFGMVTINSYIELKVPILESI